MLANRCLKHTYVKHELSAASAQTTAVEAPPLATSQRFNTLAPCSSPSSWPGVALIHIERRKESHANGGVDKMGTNPHNPPRVLCKLHRLEDSSVGHL